MRKGIRSLRRRGFLIILSFLIPFYLHAGDQPTHHEQDHNPEPSDHIHEEHSNQHKEFVPGEFVIDHIKDSHEWHIITTPEGKHISVPLPIILYSKYQGLQFFMSSKLAHGHEYKNFYISHDDEYEGKIVERTGTGEIYLPLDFSMTQIVFAMIFASIILMILFIRMGRIYKKKKLIIPSGLNGFLEPMIVFIRDEVAIPNIGKEKHERFMPYLLTVFFFILINNIMGIIPPVIPFGANVTGNIAVTMVLAIFTLVITQFSGTKDYWKHIFATPGVPFWLAPIMIPVEIVGIFVKPFALMIRLFANITAGHIIILSLVSLIFIFKTIAVAPVSIVIVLFMNILEILVAFLQAYVFTLLSALFIGLAVKEEVHV